MNLFSMDVRSCYFEQPFFGLPQTNDIRCEIVSARLDCLEGNTYLKMTNLLAHCPVVIETPVAWGQMDAFRHLNNTTYFRFFESARIAYFERLNLLEYMEATGVGPILASTSCRFKIPLTYPDTVSIGSRASEIQDDRFTMEYYVVSHQHQKVAAEGTGLIVCFDYRQNKKAPIPPELKQRIERLEASVK
jgi:acyl-CoA thioester hydrolase